MAELTVVGGGLVGCTAALGLAELGHDVTLIERQAPRRNRGRLGIDIRNVALSPASAALLGQVGGWDAVEKTPYARMVVWEQWGSGRVEFDAADAGRSELGWLVEMSPLVVQLWAELERHPGVQINYGELAAVRPAADQVILEFANGDISGTDFVIAADGAASLVRRELQVPVRQMSMDQTALATVVRTQRPHQHTAWQRFGGSGPLAFLPAPDEHLCSVVWSQSAADAQQLMALSEQQFCIAIADAIENQLGRIEEVDQRVTFPLRQQRVHNCAPHARVLLIGDAMRVVHPLAGLGVNLGLEDVARMLQVAAAAPDLAGAPQWRSFARQRAARSEMMIRTMAGLHALYTSTNPILSLVRGAGVQSFNALDGLKRQVMREAMGLGQLS